MRITSPAASATFSITAEPEWPSIDLTTDATGPHTWIWTITWKEFSKSGIANTPGNLWDARPMVENRGGLLTVRATVGNATASTTLKITGTNPSSADVSAYLATRAHSAGFDKILEKEARGKNFNAHGEPIRSFDGGYGMCQLTTPHPTFEQCWNWKLNVDAGLNLFAQKRGAALAYLGHGGRSYTEDQLNHEAVSRWNGGAYHEWDANAGEWVRKANVLCDSQTGNIGWDMNDPANDGRSEADLHKRDRGGYSAGPAASSHWKYFGVCYADRMLDD